MEYKFEQNGTGKGHEVLERKNFTISFANTSGTWFFEGDEEVETAIVTDSSYYILNGDHREEYSKCKTLAQAMKYFKSKPELKSSWSN